MEILDGAGTVESEDHPLPQKPSPSETETETQTKTDQPSSTSNAMTTTENDNVSMNTKPEKKEKEREREKESNKNDKKKKHEHSHHRSKSHDYKERDKEKDKDKEKEKDREQERDRVDEERKNEENNVGEKNASELTHPEQEKEKKEHKSKKKEKEKEKDREHKHEKKSSKHKSKRAGPSTSNLDPNTATTEPSEPVELSAIEHKKKKKKKRSHKHKGNGDDSYSPRRSRSHSSDGFDTTGSGYESVNSEVANKPRKLKDRANRRSIRLEHKKNILGETIYKGHPSWLLMRDIQTGLLNCLEKHSVATELKLDSPPSDEIFNSPEVESFPMAAGSDMTFKFKDYCPIAFQYLRGRFGIHHADYKSSLIETEWNEISTPGKSGSLFFFSHDNQYVIKTIPKHEAKLLRSILPLYFNHMMMNQNSLITRFFGLHRVKPHKGNQVRFLVMGNLFKTHKRIHERFDLKGSTVGRMLSHQERAKKSPTFKDCDFLNMGMQISIGPQLKVPFMRQLQEDVDFLSKANIMDYSLLVGVHTPHQHSHSPSPSPSQSPSNPQGGAASPSISEVQVPHMQIREQSFDDDIQFGEEIARPPVQASLLSHFPPLTRLDSPSKSERVHHHHHHLQANPKISIFEQDDGGIRKRNAENNLHESGEIFFIGIIDILMQYTMRKRLEHVYKVTLSGGRGQVSSIEPDKYARRFVKFIDSVTI